MLAQMIAASPWQSAAFDEGYTITYGYAYLRTGDARLSRGQNPPLTNVIIALPLLQRDDLKFPIDHPTWAAGDIYGFTDEFLWKANPEPQRLVMLARLPEMMLALLLACVVYAFTRSMFGNNAAQLALFLCAFDPNILAHGHIVGTDLGVTLFVFSAVWLLTSALRKRRMRLVIIAGLLGGAALASKYSAAWLVPVVLLMVVVLPRHVRLRDRFKTLIGFGLASFIIIWATFKFSIGPIGSAGVPLPAPQYWESLGKVANRVESGTPAFMLGQISPTGFVAYYPFVFLVKTPLPTLLLLLVGLAALIRQYRRDTVAIWFPPVLFLLAAMTSNLSLGYRLILPALPFALMLAGQGANVLFQALTRKTLAVSFKVVGIAFVLWLIIDALSIAPDHIAYFNQLAGDRSRDYDLLVDSNLDWGQDLITLREWQQANQVNALNLAYFGTARPNAYNLTVSLLPSFSLNDYGPEVDGFNANALPPGWYAISATSLQLGTLYGRWQLYAPFREYEPTARVGRSILVYRVSYPSSELERSVVLGPVASDLDRETLGGHTDRQLIVKWAGEDAAVLDMQGPARYITRGGEPIVGFAPDVHDALIANAQRLGSDASGNLRLFEIDARTALESKLTSLSQGEVIAPDQTELALPLKFEGGLTLLGYDLATQPEQRLDLITYWRVDGKLNRQLSIFAHVLNQAGNIASQQDGLDVRLSSLESGDVIMQHFSVNRPSDMTALEIGLYDPSTDQRFPVLDKYDHVILK